MDKLLKLLETELSLEINNETELNNRLTEFTIEKAEIVSNEIFPLISKELANADEEVQSKYVYLLDFLNKINRFFENWVVAKDKFQATFVAEIEHKREQGIELLSQEEITIILNSFFEKDQNIHESIEFLEDPRTGNALLKNFNSVLMNENLSRILKK